MTALFYVSAAVAVIATLFVITQLNAVHALLYLIVSLLAVALAFYALGAPFVAAMEVIIYAGAIMVLFVFVIMMLNLGPAATAQERLWLSPRAWVGPTLLVAVLIVELVYVFTVGSTQSFTAVVVDSKAVGIALFGPYVIGTELASMVLLAGLVGAYHLGRREPRADERGGLA